MIAPRASWLRLAECASAFLRFGEQYPDQTIVIPALFHEGERTRSLIAQLMRGLSDQGVGSTLVELHGFAEDEGSLPTDVSTWQQRVANVLAAVGATHAVSIRGGALLDDAVPARGRYRLAPVAGSAITRDLARSAAVDRSETGRPASPSTIAEEARNRASRLAGYHVPPELFASIEAAPVAAECGRVARLAGDARPADVRMAGPLLWRQSEPNDPAELATALARDIAGWMAS